MKQDKTFRCFNLPLSKEDSDMLINLSKMTGYCQTDILRFGIRKQYADLKSEPQAQKLFSILQDFAAKLREIGDPAALADADAAVASLGLDTKIGEQIDIESQEEPKPKKRRRDYSKKEGFSA